MFSPISLLYKPGLAGFLLVSMIGVTANSFALEPNKPNQVDGSLPVANLDDIARRISQQPQWRILSAEPLVQNEKTFYRFKVLNQNRGRVEVIIVDPMQPEINLFNQTMSEAN